MFLMIILFIIWIIIQFFMLLIMIYIGDKSKEEVLSEVSYLYLDFVRDMKKMEKDISGSIEKYNEFIDFLESVELEKINESRKILNDIHDERIKYVNEMINKFIDIYRKVKEC